MNMNLLFQSSERRQFIISFWITTIALISGFVLSILSWLELCVEHCSANQNYRLFGFSFGKVGIVFFFAITILYVYTRIKPALLRYVGWILASALGAEVMFIAVQRYQIGHWCPVCLSIAFSLVVAALAFSSNYLRPFFKTSYNKIPGANMKKLKKALSTLTFFMLGFLLAFIGVSKPNLAEAAAQEMKDRLAFGSKTSPIEVYFITDWFCPTCKSEEPMFEQVIPKIHSKVRYYFIDYPIHSKTLNFSPYNLAFMVNNKAQYFTARNLLAKLADTKDSPVDDDIILLSKKGDIAFKELSYLDVKAGLDFFDKVVNDNDLSATPTVLIINTKTKKTEKLEGSKDITEKNILDAINKLSK